MSRSAMHMREAAYRQGARCGFCEGQGRSMLYVIGEEYEAADEAASVNASPFLASDWAEGYRYGYRLAAEGSRLPDGIAKDETHTSAEVLAAIHRYAPDGAP